MVAKRKVPDSIEITEKGHLHMTLSGELDISSLEPILAKADLLIEELRKKKKPAKMHVDARGLEVIKLDSRKHGVEWLRRADYDKISVHGSSMFIKYFVNMLVRVIGNSMKYFTSEKEALEWLNKNDA